MDWILRIQRLHGHKWNGPIMMCIYMSQVFHQEKSLSGRAELSHFPETENEAALPLALVNNYLTGIYSLLLYKMVPRRVFLLLRAIVSLQAQFVTPQCQRSWRTCWQVHHSRHNRMQCLHFDGTTGGLVQAFQLAHAFRHLGKFSKTGGVPGQQGCSLLVPLMWATQCPTHWGRAATQNGIRTFQWLCVVRHF